MLSTARHTSTAKEYIERGVQTDIPMQACPDTSPQLDLSMEPPAEAQIDDSLRDKASSPLLEGRSRTLTQDGSAYTHDEPDLSFASTASSADRSMTTTSRAYKMNQAPANLPSVLANRQPTSRVVSLPEATPRFHMKTVLERKSARVVSMPGNRKRDVSSDNVDTAAHVDDPFGSEDEERSRVRVCSQATDVSCIPSAPSSPDSVVIIANNSNQLSNEFLRQRRVEEEPPESDDEDTEWVSWSKSPPRPIPALHGPLSLPYARCPSGAEGTIIEEPDSLPRVIWGLESDETNSSRAPHKVHNAHSATDKPAPHTTTSQPGRPASKYQREYQTSINTDVGSTTTIRPQDGTNNRTTSKPFRPQPPEFMLKHSEPIDLARLTGDFPDFLHPGYTPDQQAGRFDWQTSYQHGMPTPELVHDLSPELQAMLFAQERLRNYGLSPSSSLNDLYQGTLTASSSAISMLESLKTSRSPIILEELASQYPSPQNIHPPSLDLPHQYRQQQMHQGLLPTPPSSTSPVWSSTFLPYRGGLVSPDVLAAAGLAHLKPGYLPPQAIPRLDAAQQLIGPNSGNPLLDTRKPTRLAPAAHINPASQSLPPRLAAEQFRRRAAPEQSTPGSQLQQSQSPSVPKAPPNTPYSSASTYGSKRSDVNTQAAHTITLASPTSPRDVPHFGLGHNARSIPLSRLVQRRLSTVPEEDYASSADGRTPPAQARAHGQGSVTTHSGLHLFLSPSGRTHVSAASLGLLGDRFGTRYGADGMGESSEKALPAPPSVKLPGAHPRSAGPVPRNQSHTVKEADRRQGSSNINTDGSRRGEGGRGRGQKRGGRGRKARGGVPNGVHGAQRVDGGIVVKS